MIFALNKLYLRSWILENELPNPFIITTLSAPNLIEAIVGTLLMTGILLQIRQSFGHKFGLIEVKYVHILAVLITATYVISQELEFHNLGGNNVYDPFDLVASVIGLVGTYVVIQIFGFTDELVNNS